MKIKFKLSERLSTARQFLAPDFFINSNSEPISSDDKYFELPHLSRINLFVGANNSGKSRFLRGIFNTNFIDYQTYLNNSIDNQIIEINEHDIFKYQGRINSDYIEGPKIQRELKIYLEKLRLNDNSKPVSAYDHLANFDNFSNIYSDLRIYNATIFDRPISSKLFELISSFTEAINDLEQSFKFWAKNGSGYKCYIPLYRSLLEGKTLKKPIYQNIVKEYFDVISSEPNKIIFTGLNLYDGVDDTYRSPGKNDLERFNSFLSLNFFQNKSVDLIPDKKSNLLRISIDNGSYRSINEIGDGVQAIILIMYPIYTGESNTWFFVEEPETNLHPGFQRIFIETLLKDDFLKTKNHRYFFTTHSNHFLDLTILSDEIAIVQFEKEEENKHRIKTNVKPRKEVLDLLGVNTSSVFLANTSLWVEGPTDRKYLSKFLRIYFETDNKLHLKEDIDFTFFEYAGSLIEHYIFEDKIDYSENEVKEYINAFSSSSRIYLLADEDNAMGKKAVRDRKLKLLSSKNENFEYSNTKVKEIENLLPPFILKEFLVSQLVKKKPSEEVIDKLVFKQKDYAKIGLGKFLQDLLEKNGIPHKKFKSQKGDTLETRYKKKLCNFVIEKEFSFLQLTKNNPNLKVIIEELYSFIKK